MPQRAHREARWKEDSNSKADESAEREAPRGIESPVKGAVARRGAALRDRLASTRLYSCFISTISNSCRNLIIRSAAYTPERNCTPE